MKTYIYFLAAILLCLISSATQAQVNSEPSSEKKWGIEFNPVWPFVPGVEIFTAKATKQIWSNENSSGELTFGLLWRPGTDDDENAEEFSEFGANIGYRHYFWKGFHGELALYPSIASESNNKIDEKDYRGFALTSEFYTGYKFKIFKKPTYNFYLIPQVGLGYNLISDLGPQSEPDSIFPTLNLQVGINF